jgi:hypothetical protein
MMSGPFGRAEFWRLAEKSGNHLNIESGGLTSLDRPSDGATLAPFCNRSTMKFKHLAKWRPQNLELVRSILEEAPGALPVELENIDGAAFLSVKWRSEGRLETLSAALRQDWLEEATGIPELALAVRRFAEYASSLETRPFARVPLAA